MEHNRINRFPRRFLNENPAQLCLRCFHLGHRRGRECANDPIVACGKCFRLNYFTTECPCTKTDPEFLTQGMTFRLAGGSTPKLYMDVMVGVETYSALINTGLTKSRINFSVFQHLKSILRLDDIDLPETDPVVNFPIARRGKQIHLDLEIHRNQLESVVLGMDFLMDFGFSFTLDRVNIHENSPITRTPDTVDFVYNQPNNRELCVWLCKGYVPIYRRYKRGEKPTLHEFPKVSIHRVPSPPRAPRQHQQQYHQLEDNEDVLQIYADEDDLHEF